MSRFHAVIFDLDDTLFPERDYVLSGMHAVARWSQAALGIDAGTAYAELRAHFEQGVRGRTFNLWLEARGIVEETVVAQAVAVYREHQPELQPFPEVPALLDDLQARYRLGLVSDGYLDVQRAKLRALGLANRFAAVVFSDQLGRDAWKPSPRPLLEVTRLLGVDPGQAVYVADNPLKDFLAARRAGAGSLWLRRKGGEYTGLEPPDRDHAPDHIVTSFPELRAMLLQNTDISIERRPAAQKGSGPV